MVAVMDPATADAFRHRDDATVRVAEATHAIPACEETKRERIRGLVNVVLAGMSLAFLCVVVHAATSNLAGNEKELAWVLAACVGTPLAGFSVYRFTRPKPHHSRKATSSGVGSLRR